MRKGRTTTIVKDTLAKRMPIATRMRSTSLLPTMLAKYQLLMLDQDCKCTTSLLTKMMKNSVPLKVLLGPPVLLRPLCLNRLDLTMITINSEDRVGPNQHSP